MSSAAVHRALRVWQAPIGKKAVMAVTGVILFGFVAVHMAANLQYFLGGTALDDYGAKLREMPLLLWGTRAVLLLAVVLHIVAAVQLTALSRAARPQAYKVKGTRGSSLANRTMFYGGLVLFVFIVYHLLHMTTGQAHPEFVHGAVRQNVITGFQVIPVAAFYLFAMVMVCLHLYHGVWSLTQSLGFNHPRYTPRIKMAAKLFAIVVAVGFALVPLAVLAGVGTGS
jgi:succinate dehydrogenase / fumarate reductase cytochrome b subunit